MASKSSFRVEYAIPTETPVKKITATCRTNVRDTLIIQPTADGTGVTFDVTEHFYALDDTPNASKCCAVILDLDTVRGIHAALGALIANIKPLNGEK